MKLIIDISKEQKKMVDKFMMLPPQVENDLISAIRHGIPLREEQQNVDDNSAWEFHWDGVGNYEDGRRRFYGDFS